MTVEARPASLGGMRPSNAAVLRDPVLDAFDRAPRVQKLTAEQRAELDQMMEDIASGRVALIAHEDVPAWFEEQALREQGA